MERFRVESFANTAMNKQCGISLVELLIALAIGLLLLVCVIEIFNSQKQLYQFSQSLARLQENGRMAIVSLSRDVRMAGFVGCGRLSEMQIQGLAVGDSVVGWHSGYSTTSIRFPELSKNLVSNADVLLIQTVESTLVNLQDKRKFQPRDVLLISDCHHAEVVRASDFRLHYIYQKDAQVGHLLKIVYYIGKTNRNNKLGNPIYALYRRDLNGPAQVSAELVEGVEDMQVIYGVKTSENNIDFYTADKVPDWSQVQGVQIKLLLTGVEGSLKREWSVFVALRERL